MGKVWTVEGIKTLLTDNDEMVRRSLIKLYGLQTEDERQEETTKHGNGVGFNGADAAILSSIARQYIEQKWISRNQLALVRRRIMKYAGQIAAVANKVL